MNLSKNSNGSLGLLLSALVIVVVAGIAVASSSGGPSFAKSLSSKNLARAGEAMKGTPASPEGLTVVADGIDSVNVSWLAVQTPKEDFPVTSYNLYYQVVSEYNETIFTVNVSEGAVTKNVNGLTDGKTYRFYVAAINETGEGSNSQEVLVTLGANDVEFTYSDLNITVDRSGKFAKISYTTSIPSTYEFVYSPIDDDKIGKILTTSKEGSTDHSIDMPNLATCSKYWFYLNITDNTDPKKVKIVSEKGEFTTSGCKGGSSILSVNSDNVSKKKSAIIETNGGVRKIIASVPADLKTSQPDMFIQAVKLEKENVKAEISSPTGKKWAGDNAYSLKAFNSEVEQFDGTFDKPVTVSINYEASDVAGLDMDSLSIYHYEDAFGWRPLNSCTNNASTEGGTITCTTNSFSIFGLFGEEPAPTPEPTPTPQNSGGSSGSTSSGSRVLSPSANNQNVETINVTQEILQPTITPSQTDGKSFTKDLWYGLKDSEVELLQQSLNKLGFEVSNSGAGSVGSETNFFGPLTQSALIKFQEKNREEVLEPLGLTSGTGYFGTYSRKLIKALLGI